MKKFLAVILCVLIFSGMIPTEIIPEISLPSFSFSAKAATSEYYTYNVSNGEATITDCNTSISGNVTIPSTLGGYPVTLIDSYAFKDCSSLTQVTIPDSVTIIEYRAFYNCGLLTSVTIPDSVSLIGQEAFENCSSLTEVNITDLAAWCNMGFGYRGNPLKYAKNLYIDGTLATNIVIPNSVTEIKYGAFEGCDIVDIKIPESVTSIGDHAFSRCSSLTSITIPDSVTSIGKYAFSFCSSLAEINIPDGVKSIYDHTFFNCSSLTSITIPDSVTSIGDSAFEGCSSLTKVNITDLAAWCNINFYDYVSNPLYYAKNLYINETLATDIVIPDSVTEIKRYAFYNCSSLTSITIPDSVTSIGEDAFYFCFSLTEVNITDLAAWCNINFYDSDSNPLYYAKNLYIDGIIASSIVIPDTVTKINAYAFYYCKSLTSITISDSVTSINEYAFAGSSIENIIIKNGLKYIGIDAFSSCNSLTSITIPDNVSQIDFGAFQGCRKLTKIVLPHSIYIDSTSFFNTGYYNDSKNWENDVLYISNFLVEAKQSLSGEYVIKQGTTTILDHAFSYCSSLTYVTIPDSVTSIGENAFYKTGYYNDSSNWENNVLYIDDYLVDVNTSLSGNCIIKQGTKTIADYAFYGCNSLTAISIPDSVTNIGQSVFYNSRIKTVYYCGSEEDWNKISIGTVNSDLTKATKYFGHNFQDGVCTYCNVNYVEMNLKYSVSNGEATITDCDTSISGDIVIPSTLGGYPVTRIGTDAFETCHLLTKVTIPNSVTSIGESAFERCDSLTEVIILDGVTSIERDAFFDCKALTEITIPDSVLNIGYGAFGWCYSLEAINVDPENPNYLSENGILFNKDKTELINYAAKKDVTSYTIPEGIKSIGVYAFWGRSSLTSITIPKSVTSIGLVAFSGCSSLTSITIPNGVTAIGTFTFDGCTSLTSIVIPDSVISIGQDAFSWCNSLKTVYYCGTEDDWNKISIEKYNYELTNAIKYYGHILDDWTIKTNATCSNEGEKCSICLNCGKEVIESIPIDVNNHNFNEWTDKTNATCTTEGVKSRTCISCGKEETEPTPINPDNHDYSPNFTTDKEATLFEEGSKSKHCSRCDSVTDVTVIPKTSVADGVCGENVLWAISENGTLVIIGNGATTGYKFNIYTPWYDYSEQITSIEVANTITSIGNRNFNSLTNVKDVIINNPDTTFGYYVFPTNGNTVIHSFGNSDVEEYAKNNNIIFEKFANPETPVNPVLVKRSGYSVELQKIENYEYSIDGELWQESNIFEDLDSGKTYSFYQRIKSGIYAPSEKSEVLEVTTLAAPSAPIIESFNGSTVTLKKISGYEYSSNGKTWQSNNVFANLETDKVISFYQRVAENGINAPTPASEASKYIIVSAPKVLVGNMSLKVKPISGYEYCLDDMVWQDSNVFEELIPEETYTVYQRPKNTNGITVAYNNTGTTVVINGNDPTTSPNATNLAWLKKLLLKSDKSNNLAADFNNDGEIDIRDLVRLKKALA